MWTPKKLENNNFEEAIQKVVSEFGISEKKAASLLMRFMLSHGDIDDFKDFINYFIKNQERWFEDGNKIIQMD
ncbi:MAG: hypothetical protein ACFE8A_13330 [Candidatus Hodarchaeota archaeon]